MIRALRKVSVERGLDPREFTLVPFGGAGPLHAGLLLRHLRPARRAGAPPARAVLRGRAARRRPADRRVADGAAAVRRPDAVELSGLGSATPGGALAGQLVADDVDPIADVTVAASADCRYVGQGFELNVAA